MKKKYLILTVGGCAAAAALLSSCATNNIADANKDGVLTVPELETALVDAIIEYSDKDRDGSVTFAEWSAVNDAADASLFRQRDLNYDGTLDRAEALKSTQQSDTWDRLIAKIDLNGDGKIDESEKAAFRTEMAKADDDQVNKLRAIANEKK
jgi:Ca2+-binding EF-hand superfamily protein